VIAPGDVAPRRDTDAELYVAVLSNSMHLAAATGRLIACPFIPGPVPDDAMALVVPVADPSGTLLPELIQWLPVAAVDDPIGNVGPEALRAAGSIATALITE
jgi:hypothetical protein